MARFRKNGKFNRKINFVRSSKMKYMNKICTDDHPYGKFTDSLQDDHEIISNCELDVGASVTVSNDPSHDDSWKEGRRVVELLHLAENLYCKMCNCPLQLLDTVGERKYGLGSVLYIHCSSCKACNSVETGKRNGKGAFIVNSKAAIGMIHAGIGSTHVNNFLSGLNVPSVNPSTIKKKENEVGKKIHEAAIESCKTVQQQEKNLSNGKIEVSFDGGWQKRGSGWHYDSNTGHASMIGSITGKVMDFSLRSRICKVCEYHQQRKEIVPAHDCSKNWYGSSKGMEPDMAVEMTHNLKDSGCQIQVLHADNDSTTTSRLKVDFDDLEKKDDQNHVKKGFSKKLYELSKKFKELKHPDVIPYIVRCFMYAVKENTGSVENIQLALKRMVLHIFGDHTLCENAEWCTYAKDPFNFKYSSLPNGECLSNDALKQELSEVVGKYERRANTLQNMGSTQANENFNHIVASKAPKSRSYGGSSSLSNRLSASVLQKNEGYTWLSKVNEASLLSPGQHTLKLAKQMDRRLNRHRINQKTTHFKRRRIQLRKLKKKSEFRSQIKEGTTYENETEVNDAISDIQQIPSRLTINDSEEFIIFDLETTGLSRNSDITQIAASSGSNIFQRYIMPRCEITHEASKITGLTFSHSTNKMYLNGTIVQTCAMEQALLDFIDFLKLQNKPVLVGHNITNFDMMVLENRLREFSLFATFSAHVKGFIDTLKLSKRVFPKDKVGNYKQQTLVKEVLGTEYHAHNAKEDVLSLKELFYQKLRENCTDDDLHHVNFYHSRLSLKPLVDKKVINTSISFKLARSGITLSHLKIAKTRDINGIKVILTENRVNSKYVGSIIQHLTESEE